jgi:hypothetical protein
MPDTLVLADVNADGMLDVVLTDVYHKWGPNEEDLYDVYASVALGNRDGTFRGADSHLINESVMQVSVAIAVAEFNGDGKPDLAIRSDGFVYILAGNGDGTFGEDPSTPQPVWRSPLVVADFNGDGNADLATTGTVLLGNGDGTLQPQIQYRTGYGEAAAAGDFNDDGRPDLAVTSSNVSVFVNDGAWPAVNTPWLQIGNATVTEGNAGAVAATFTVTLSAASTQPVTVAYATGNDTATVGSDYTSTSGTLTFATGQTSETITVLVNGDRLAEPNETFVVNLSNPSNATIADGQGVGTIVDDEPRVSISDVSMKEGKKNQTTQFTFTVTLSASYDQAVTMSSQTVNGTATTSDNDYVAKNGTLIFAPGETTKTITIVVNGDSKKEADETFYLDLFGLSSNALFTKKRGVGTILNDD